jgi:hypothetical protein
MNNWQNRIFSPGPLLQLELKFSAHEAFPFPKAVAGLRGYDLLEGGKRPLPHYDAAACHDRQGLAAFHHRAPQRIATT